MFFKPWLCAEQGPGSLTDINECHFSSRPCDGQEGLCAFWLYSWPVISFHFCALWRGSPSTVDSPLVWVTAVHPPGGRSSLLILEASLTSGLCRAPCSGCQRTLGLLSQLLKEAARTPSAKLSVGSLRTGMPSYQFFYPSRGLA